MGGWEPGRVWGFAIAIAKMQKVEGWEGQKESHEHELSVPPFFLFEMGGWEGVWEAGRVWSTSCLCRLFFLFEIGRKIKDTGGEQEPRGRG